ncbi:hypothetical protein EZS27_020959 [termite gut metagenome]|uniref:Uncharacterized protein n=1 Tax=termite gut metagenome TaxID=433724 RepID=A0A5J4RB05_9ZZZZ
MLDGLKAFKSLFPTDDAFVEHVIQSIYFFESNIVQHQAEAIRKDIHNGTAIPVRYTSNGAFYIQRKVNKITPTFNSKGEAVKFTANDQNFVHHRETEIRVKFDKDGNYAPKQTIRDYTGHWVSGGASSTVVNYVIAHTWNKTDNPLYFSPLWNYCLIAYHCAYLTDKKDDSDPVIKRIKDLIKAISLELYHPNEIMKQTVITVEDMPTQEAMEEARQLIQEKNQEKKIHFVLKSERDRKNIDKEGSN